MFTDFTRLCFRKQESVRVSFPTYLAGPETAEGNLKNGRNEGCGERPFRCYPRDWECTASLPALLADIQHPRSSSFRWEVFQVCGRRQRAITSNLNPQQGRMP